MIKAPVAGDAQQQCVCLIIFVSFHPSGCQHVGQLEAALTERNEHVSNLESALTKQKEENEELKDQVWACASQ